MKKWEVKNDKKKEYKTAFGTTDYDIPMFGYKSALLIFGGETIIVMLILFICDKLKFNYRWPITILAPLSFSLLVAYSQFFLERKLGFIKKYFITVIIIFVLFFIIFYLLIFKNIII